MIFLNLQVPTNLSLLNRVFVTMTFKSKKISCYFLYTKSHLEPTMFSRHKKNISEFFCIVHRYKTQKKTQKNKREKRGGLGRGYGFLLFNDSRYRTVSVGISLRDRMFGCVLGVVVATVRG